MYERSETKENVIRKAELLRRVFNVNMYVEFPTTEGGDIFCLPFHCDPNNISPGVKGGFFKTYEEAGEYIDTFMECCIMIKKHYTKQIEELENKIEYYSSIFETKKRKM